MAGAIASVVALIGGLSIAVATLVSGPLGLAVAAIGSFAAAYASNLGGVRDVTNSVVGAVVDAVEQILPPFDEIVETGELVVEIFEDVFAVYADEFEGIGDSAGDAFGTIVDAVDDAMPPIEDIQAAIEQFGDALVFANRQFARILGEITARLSGFSSVVERRFNIVIGLVSSVVDVFESLGRGVQSESDRIRSATRGLTNTLSGIFDGLLDTLQTITSKINDALAFLVNNLLRPTLKEIGDLYESQYGDLIAETIETVDVVLKRFKALMSALKTAIKPALDAIALLWDTFGDEITAVVEAAFDAIKLVVVSIMDALLTTIRTTLALIRGDWKEAFNILRNFAERRFEGVRDYVTEWGGRFLSAISNAVSKGIDEFERIVDNGMNAVESRIDDVIDEILGIGDIDIDFPTVPTWLENLLDGTASVIDVGIDLPNFSWSNYIGSLNWYDYLDNLDWHDWLGYDWQFDWSDFVPSLDWDDFIGDLDDLASFSEGGYVGEGEEGLAMLHGPEYIIPQNEMPSQKVGSRGELAAPISASMSSSSSSGGGGTTVVIKKIMASGRDEGRRAAKALTAELRSAGLNDPI
jgi:phage-related protein